MRVEEGGISEELMRFALTERKNILHVSAATALRGKAGSMDFLPSRLCFIRDITNQCQA